MYSNSGVAAPGWLGGEQAAPPPHSLLRLFTKRWGYDLVNTNLMTQIRGRPTNFLHLAPLLQFQFLNSLLIHLDMESKFSEPPMCTISMTKLISVVDS